MSFDIVSCSIQCKLYPPFAVPGSVGSEPQTTRQLWGLAVRGERALRASAPLWLAQQAAWGDAADLLVNTAEPVSSLCQGVRKGSVILPASATIPLARLLLSYAATELKAARVAGLEPGFCIFDSMAAAIRASCSALSTSVISLLLPRMASSMPTGSTLFACNALAFVEQAIHGYSLTNLLVHTSHHMSVLLNRAVSDVIDSPATTATSPQACWAVMTRATYASSIVNASFHIVQQGRGQLPPDVRARLAQPILMLLNSPLLAHLASLQHVVVSSSNTNLSQWQFPEGSGILPMCLLSAQMEPDAADSDLAMQVGLSRTFLNSFLPDIVLPHVFV